MRNSNIAGYIHASLKFKSSMLKTVGHCKVDHQGSGLGGLLIQAAETPARKLGSPFTMMKLSILDSSEHAKKYYAKAGFAAHIRPSQCSPTIRRSIGCRWRHVSAEGRFQSFTLQGWLWKAGLVNVLVTEDSRASTIVVNTGADMFRHQCLG